MTSATSAPVTVPRSATPNRISSQPTIRPPSDETYAASPWPSTVAKPQLNESNSDSTDHGFSIAVTSSAAAATKSAIPCASDRKNRLSSCPPTRRTCHVTRRMIGLATTTRDRNDGMRRPPLAVDGAEIVP
jgi:hypothetical protein